MNDRKIWKHKYEHKISDIYEPPVTQKTGAMQSKNCLQYYHILLILIQIN